MIEQWVLRADQWSQTYYRVKDGRLFFVENDNKEQQTSERELDIDAFMRQHAATTTSPEADVVRYLRGMRRAP